jgi:hypothetical protein
MGTWINAGFMFVTCNSREGLSSADSKHANTNHNQKTRKSNTQLLHAFFAPCILNTPTWNEKNCSKLRILRKRYHRYIPRKRSSRSQAMWEHKRVFLKEDKIYSRTLTYLSFLFERETEANCNPIYVHSTIITVIIIKVYEHCLEHCFSFFPSDSLVYRKLIVERTV